MQVAHVNFQARTDQSLEYFELMEQLQTTGLDGKQEQDLHNELNAVASKVASR